MSEKKNAEAPEKNSDGKDSKPEGGGDKGFARGIWGLVWLSAGLLFFIALLFYSKDADGHILGKPGVFLANGMFYVFGRLTAFIFAAIVCYIGLAKLINRPARIAVLFFLVVLAIEICLLGAISRMPALAGGTLADTVASAGSNYVGLFLVNALLVPLFEAHVFGPYFIVSVLTAITVMIGLRVGPRSIFAFAAKAFGEAKPAAVPGESPAEPDSPAPAADPGSPAPTTDPTADPAADTAGSAGDGSGAGEPEPDKKPSDDWIPF